MTSAHEARKKKLDGIIRKITMFILLQTYTDEEEAQTLLKRAVKLIEIAKSSLKSDK